MIGEHINLMGKLFAKKKFIILVFDIEGHHSWPNGPEDVQFLSYDHRHLFRIRICQGVNHNNREKEIFLQQQLYQNYLKEKYETSVGNYTYHNFGSKSCESIAEEIINLDSTINWVEVLEDNLGGARIER